MIAQAGMSVVNIDCTLVMEAPKISPYKLLMRQNIATVCALPVERVAVKATTSEKLGFVGAKQGAQAYAVCMLRTRNE